MSALIVRQAYSSGKFRRALWMVAGVFSAAIISGSLLTHQHIPVTWNVDSIKVFHLSPPDSTVTVLYAPREYYESLPEHVIYRTYPVYAREFERPGYLDSLRTLEPEVMFDPRTLKTPEDWVKAGEVVFNWPVAYTPMKESVSRVTRADYDGKKSKLTSDGRALFNRYVITEKGSVMVGSLSCASCHTRILDSGEIVAGAQGNVATGAGLVRAIRSGAIPFEMFQHFTRRLSFAPWAPDAIRSMPATAEEAVNYFEAMPAGVIDRQGVAFLNPVTVPSLIGVKDIKYLDYTGLMRHDSPGDMMRYAAFNQGMDMLTAYNGFIPGGDPSTGGIPANKKWNHPFGYAAKRYSDEQLYALTQYIYSLQAPANPDRYPEALVNRGKQVFIKQACITCHTPPLYTSNQLTPANGFTPPAEHLKKYDIFNVSVDTDSVATMYSRRGTGYYKIPSLRGVWFRSAFFHNGHLTSLEEVLDPGRLRSDYVPTGYLPPGKKSMAVKGHPFGLKISAEDKKAMIAFLKTL